MHHDPRIGRLAIGCNYPAAAWGRNEMSKKLATAVMVLGMLVPRLCGNRIFRSHGLAAEHRTEPPAKSVFTRRWHVDNVLWRGGSWLSLIRQPARLPSPITYNAGNPMPKIDAILFVMFFSARYKQYPTPAVRWRTENQDYPIGPATEKIR